MRFDSYFDYQKFVMGLCLLGYSTPFIEYKEDMKNNGLNKHIHMYRVKMQIENTDVRLIFTDGNKEVYYTLLKRR